MRVGIGRLVAAPHVTRRSRVTPHALRTASQLSALIKPGYRATASPDRYHVNRREHYGVAPFHVPALHCAQLSVCRHRYVCASTSHVQTYHVQMPCHPSDLCSSDGACSGARVSGSHRYRLGNPNAHESAARLGYQDVSPIAFLRHAAFEVV